ncbi:MAG: folate family ECF transporter S component [Christensenellaceae bacterium]|nr:folate family ECF transporter S component [Christensenellaceae bacterium]
MKKTKNKNYLLKLVYTAFLSALSVALNAVEINIVIAKITFSYIPIFLAGSLLGPISGILVGFIGDSLGFLLSPQGIYYPVFTISSALMGLIVGIVFKYTNLKETVKIVASFILIFLICTISINSTAIYYLYIAGSKAFDVYLLSRLATQAPILIVNTLLAITIYYPLKYKVLPLTGYKGIIKV